MIHTSTTEPRPVGADTALYRRVWRWHFYAGLLCLPFLALLAVTGGLYLYKDAIEARLHAGLFRVATASSTSKLHDAQDLVSRALAAVPGQAVRYVAPPAAGRSAEVGVRDAQGIVAVYLDPADGRVLGTLRDDSRPMEIVKRLHSLVLVGTIANLLVEVVAGWAIVLVLTGVVLWWPRGRSGGVLSVRGRPARRVWWRDLHAVTGVLASAAILFLAVTGMPWSAFWGERYAQWSARWGLGVPASMFESPASREPSALDGLRQLPWGLAQAPVPRSSVGPERTSPSEGHGQHGDHAGHGGVGALPDVAADAAAPAIDFGLNRAMARLTELGVPAGTPVRLPTGPRDVFTAMSFPDDVRQARVVHLDRYSGAVLADVGYDDYGALGRVTEWGVSLHTGRQFGAANQAVMLVGCLAVLVLALTSVVMWWKRRPRGRLAAPPRRPGDRATGWAVAIAIVLGVSYPLLGASMLAALLVDAMWPVRWRQRWSL